MASGRRGNRVPDSGFVGDGRGSGATEIGRALAEASRPLQSVAESGGALVHADHQPDEPTPPDHSVADLKLKTDAFMRHHNQRPPFLLCQTAASESIFYNPEQLCKVIDGTQD